MMGPRVLPLGPRTAARVLLLGRTATPRDRRRKERKKGGGRAKEEARTAGRPQEEASTGGGGAKKKKAQEVEKHVQFSLQKEVHDPEEWSEDADAENLSHGPRSGGETS